jgi:hypothetical protein
MEAEIVATTNRLLRTFPTLTPSVVWDFGFERRIPYRTIARTLAELARAGRLECVGPVTLAYRAPKGRRWMPRAPWSRLRSRERIAAPRHADGQGVLTRRDALRPAI